MLRLVHGGEHARQVFYHEAHEAHEGRTPCGEHARQVFYHEAHEAHEGRTACCAASPL